MKNLFRMKTGKLVSNYLHEGFTHSADHCAAKAGTIVFGAVLFADKRETSPETWAMMGSDVYFYEPLLALPETVSVYPPIALGPILDPESVPCECHGYPFFDCPSPDLIEIGRAREWSRSVTPDDVDYGVADFSVAEFAASA